MVCSDRLAYLCATREVSHVPERTESTSTRGLTARDGGHGYYFDLYLVFLSHNVTSFYGNS